MNSATTETANSKSLSLFVTVGTTKFDALIQKICSLDFFDVLIQLNYTELKVQYGHSNFNLPPILSLSSSSSLPEEHHSFNSRQFDSKEKENTDKENYGLVEITTNNTTTTDKTKKTREFIFHSSSSSPAESTSTPKYTLTTSNNRMNKLSIIMYPFKPSLRSDMEKASTIISHAGSGSILESLELHKRLLVCINDTLMDNHQQELALKLEKENHLSSCSPVSLFSAFLAIHPPQAKYNQHSQTNNNHHQLESNLDQTFIGQEFKPFVVGKGSIHVCKILEEVSSISI